MDFKRSAVAYLSVFLFASVAFSQSTPANQKPSPNDLVRAIVAGELSAQAQDSGHHWMYRVEREEQGTRMTKEVVQTAQASLERVIAINGRPLTAKEQWDEKQRIASFLKNTAEQQRADESKRRDAAQCRAFFKMIPDAFIFSYAGEGGDLIKLNFRPNPSFQPHTHEAHVFHEMEGEMWVSSTQRRLVRIRGQLIADVKFAGGLLGHLDKGGRFMVEQRELSPGEWDIASMEVDMKGKALVFKTIAVQQKEYRSDFRAVPANLTLAEAANRLTSKVLVAATR